MNTLRIEDGMFKMASCWGELSFSDLLFLGREFPLRDTADFHAKVLLHFVDLKNNAWLKDILSGERIYDILTMGGKGSLFGWLFDEPVMEKCLVRSFKVEQFPFAKVLQGPTDMLYNLTLGEFRYAESCLNEYLSSKKRIDLATFLAVIYRPKAKNENGDDREAFSVLKVDVLAEVILKSISIEHMHALMLQYIAMRGYVINAHKDAFESGGTAKSQNATWGGLINQLAQNITDIPEIENKLLWRALEWLVHKKQNRVTEPVN